MNVASPQIKKLISREVSLSLFFSDVVALSLAYFVSWITFLVINSYFSVQIDKLDLRSYNYFSDYAFISLYPIILSLFFLKGHYTQRVPWWSQVRYLFLLCVVAFGADCLFRFGLRLSLLSLLVTISWVYSFVFILTGRQIVYRLLNRQGVWQVNAVVIGSVSTVTDILYALHADNYTGYNIQSIFLRDRTNKEFKIDSVPSKYKNIKICRDDMGYIDFIKENLDCFFIVCLDTFRGEERDELIKELTDMNILYSVIPPTSSISLSEMKPQNFFGSDVMMLHSKNNIFSLLGGFLKRTMDVFLSFIALVLIFPIFVMVAVALKVEGQGGSVFYGGERIGRHGKLFKCWKFRSYGA